MCWRDDIMSLRFCFAVGGCILVRWVSITANVSIEGQKVPWSLLRRPRL